MTSRKPVRITDLRRMKQAGEKITMLTAYDTPTARLLDGAGLDVLLVGDSVGMVMLGHDSTLPVTLDAMVHHTAAVSRGAARRAGGGRHAISELPGDRGRGDSQCRPAAAGRRRGGPSSWKAADRLRRSSGAWWTSAFR